MPAVLTPEELERMKLLAGLTPRGTVPSPQPLRPQPDSLSFVSPEDVLPPRMPAQAPGAGSFGPVTPDPVIGTRKEEWSPHNDPRFVLGGIGLEDGGPPPAPTRGGIAPPPIQSAGQAFMPASPEAQFIMDRQAQRARGENPNGPIMPGRPAAPSLTPEQIASLTAHNEAQAAFDPRPVNAMQGASDVRSGGRNPWQPNIGMGGGSDRVLQNLTSNPTGTHWQGAQLAESGPARFIKDDATPAITPEQAAMFASAQEKLDTKTRARNAAPGTPEAYAGGGPPPEPRAGYTPPEITPEIRAKQEARQAELDAREAERVRRGIQEGDARSERMRMRKLPPHLANLEFASKRGGMAQGMAALNGDTRALAAMESSRNAADAQKYGADKGAEAEKHRTDTYGGIQQDQVENESTRIANELQISKEQIAVAREEIAAGKSTVDDIVQATIASRVAAGQEMTPQQVSRFRSLLTGEPVESAADAGGVVSNPTKEAIDNPVTADELFRKDPFLFNESTFQDEVNRMGQQQTDKLKEKIEQTNVHGLERDELAKHNMWRELMGLPQINPEDVRTELERRKAKLPDVERNKAGNPHAISGWGPLL